MVCDSRQENHNYGQKKYSPEKTYFSEEYQVISKCWVYFLAKYLVSKSQ